MGIHCTSPLHPHPTSRKRMVHHHLHMIISYIMISCWGYFGETNSHSHHHNNSLVSYKSYNYFNVLKYKNTVCNPWGKFGVNTLSHSLYLTRAHFVLFLHHFRTDMYVLLMFKYIWLMWTSLQEGICIHSHLAIALVHNFLAVCQV